MLQTRAEAIEQIRCELVRLAYFRKLGLDGARLAHELRTPLSSLALHLELELDEVLDHPERRAAVGAMLQTCEHVIATTDRFLQQARIPVRDRSIDERIDALCAPLSVSLPQRVSASRVAGGRARPRRGGRACRSRVAVARPR